jgi:Tol biopolymer transport system component
MRDSLPFHFIAVSLAFLAMLSALSGCITINNPTAAAPSAPPPTPQAASVAAPTAETKPVQTADASEYKILFTRYDKRDQSQNIFVMNKDGSGVANLTNSAKVNRVPSFTSDHKRIVFESNRNRSWPGESDVFIMDADGNNVRQINRDYGGSGPCFQFPSLSPDGTRVLYCKSRVTANAAMLIFRYDIYLSGLDGAVEKQVSTMYGDETAVLPRWIPDGNKIAYMYTEAGFYYIGWLDLANGDSGKYGLQLNMPASQGDLLTYDISPDGTRIAYSYDTNRDYWNSGREIAVIDLTSGKSTQLTKNDIWDDNPCWSPDAKKIVYYTSKGICTMNADGTNSALVSGSARGDVPYECR